MQIVATLAQLARLGQYISEVPENEALQLLGDFNIPRDRDEFKLLKYLLPLDDQPTAVDQYSYDSEKNPLVQDKDRFTLDYIATRGYAITTTEIIIDEHTKAISDHFPLRVKLKYKQVAKLLDRSVQEKQQRILSQLVQSAYQQIAKKGWQTTAGQRIHFAVLSLIEAIERLDTPQRVKLGSGDEFLSYCLEYKLPMSAKLTNLYFQPSENVLYFPLTDLIEYKVNTPSPEATRFNSAANKYLAQIKQYLEQEISKLNEKNVRIFQARFTEIFNNEKLLPWQKITYLYKIANKSPQVAKFIKDLQIFYDQLNFHSPRNQVILAKLWRGIVSNVSITITEKEAELAETLEKKLAAILNREVDELESFLMAFKRRVYQLYDENTFPATGIKRLKKLLQVSGEFYDFEGNVQKQAIISFLKSAHKIIDDRLLIHSTRRTAEMQFFYVNAEKYLNSLLQSEHLTHFSSLLTLEEQAKRTETIFSDLQKNANWLNKNVEIEDEFFLTLSKNFLLLEEQVNSAKWDTKGQGFFAKKTPTGITVLRKLLRDVPQNEWLTATEKVKRRDNESIAEAMRS